ncbi:hypothetical protein GCM10008927_21090 [Amylibacter ulvae]|uniref:DUF995 domain-containing protein n=1 Tax=Paramylibacter ulvae TaxID=1651968 RepID=A0ABQ3D3N0_9RHOB|nr:hypothetical protein [Amylibacter ulvae]GHA55027.1 hypothetical protein GCM10008927_21090 [Amylibacter ulvae]
MRSFAVIFCFIAGVQVCFAQTPETLVTPEKFRSISEGKTLYFYQFGEFYGVEKYFENGQSIWKPANGTCESGQWHAEGNQICFEYQDNPIKSCWNIYQSDQGYHARINNNPAYYDLHLGKVNDDDIICPAPELSS